MDGTGGRRQLRPPPAHGSQAEQDGLLRQAVRIHELRAHISGDFEALASGFLGIGSGRRPRSGAVGAQPDQMESPQPSPATSRRPTWRDVRRELFALRSDRKSNRVARDLTQPALTSGSGSLRREYLRRGAWRAASARLRLLHRLSLRSSHVATQHEPRFSRPSEGTAIPDPAAFLLYLTATPHRCKHVVSAMGGLAPIRRKRRCREPRDGGAVFAGSSPPGTDPGAGNVGHGARAEARCSRWPTARMASAASSRSAMPKGERR